VTYGATEAINGLEPFPDNWEAFGWKVHCIDGHNLDRLRETWELFCESSVSRKPFVVIADTIKGKGIPSLEGKSESHHGVLTEVHLRELQT